MALETVCDKDSINDLLDRLTLRQLHLMEEKMCSELNIEGSINNGCFHLAKSRYIMGQNSVSKDKLPVETSSEFSASTMCDIVEIDGEEKFKIVENDTNIVNPTHWFGVLVPQNLHKAKSIFQNALNFVVECANIQLQLQKNFKAIKMLKNYLKETAENTQ